MSACPNSRVLLVEDDPNSSRLISDYLQINHFDLTCVSDGLSAVAAAEAAATAVPFDMVLLDLRLPGQNGFVVAEHLRSTPEGAALPIIVLSAFTDQHNKLRAYSAGANFFLGKPINPQELLFIIQNLLGQQSAKQQLSARNPAQNHQTQRPL